MASTIIRSELMWKKSQATVTFRAADYVDKILAQYQVQPGPMRPISNAIGPAFLARVDFTNAIAVRSGHPPQSSSRPAEVSYSSRDSPILLPSRCGQGCTARRSV